MLTLNKSRVIGLMLVIISAFALSTLLQKAYAEAMIVKYTCFGHCASEPSEEIKAKINFDKLQEENYKRKLIAEVIRNKQ